MKTTPQQPQSATLAAEASNPVVIVTHDGPIHADEVFAIQTLTNGIRFEPFAGKELYRVIRTRDPEVIAKADIVVDVGGVYDVDAERFDHHQPEFVARRGNDIPFASFGLVWMEYGPKFVASVMHRALKLEAEPGMMCLKVAAKVDETLVQHVDAADTGFKKPGGYSVSAVISSFNPAWLESPQDFDKGFDDASHTAGHILSRAVRAAYAEVKAEDEVGAALAEMRLHRWQIAVLERYVPWQRVAAADPDVMFVVYPAHDGIKWMVQSVPAEAGSFESRRLLPKEWAGLQAEALAAETGVSDAVFCHRNCFLAGAESKASALTLAYIALGPEEPK